MPTRLTLSVPTELFGWTGTSIGLPGCDHTPPAGPSSLTRPPEHNPYIDASLDLQVPSKKSGQMVRVDEFIGRLTRAVVPTRQYSDACRDAATTELVHELTGEVHGECQIVLRIHQQRFASSCALEIGPGADRPPQLTQEFELHMAVQRRSDMRRRETVPDDIGKKRRNVIQRLRADERLV